MPRQNMLAFLPFWMALFALGCLTLLLLWRKVYRRLPFFFLYVLSAVLIGAARYITAFTAQRAYFYTYWISELAGAVIISLALYEILLRRLFPGFQKLRFYRHLFPIAATIILFLTIVTALNTPDRRAAFLMASRAFDFLRTAVLIFIVALMAVMGRNWTRYDFGVALGFGVQAVAALINAAVRTRLHYQPTFLGTIELLSYDASCIIWLITFLRPEQPPSALVTDNIPTESLLEARKWESALKDWLTPGKK